MNKKPKLLTYENTFAKIIKKSQKRKREGASRPPRRKPKTKNNVEDKNSKNKQNKKAMTTIIIMLCASFAILAGYTAYAIWRAGVPRNLSETYYTLKERGYPGGLFCVAMLLTALFAIVPMIEAGGPEYLAFISCVSLMFVALAPEFGMRIEGKVHFTATAVAGTAALAWSATAFHLSWITPAAALLAIVYPIVKDRRKWLFWLEMAVFAATYINIAIGLILR